MRADLAAADDERASLRAELREVEAAHALAMETLKATREAEVAEGAERERTLKAEKTVLVEKLVSARAGMAAMAEREKELKAQLERWGASTQRAGDIVKGLKEATRLQQQQRQQRPQADDGLDGPWRMPKDGRDSESFRG